MRRRLPTNAVVLLGYASVSFAYFGWRLLPHPGRPYVGQGRDPQIFIWSFAWWPHAILHGQNPFVTHAIFAPDGLNLTWATSVPGLAIAFSPLTLLFGPTASYNVAALLMPALAAFTAYLLCRHLTRSTWASVAGGYLFGFSSYVLGQELGHMHASSVFLLPLVALVTVRFIEGALDGRGLALRLGVLLALQLTFSTEILFTASLALAVALALAFVFTPHRPAAHQGDRATARRRLRAGLAAHEPVRLLRAHRLRVEARSTSPRSSTPTCSTSSSRRTRSRFSAAGTSRRTSRATTPSAAPISACRRW